LFVVLAGVAVAVLAAVVVALVARGDDEGGGGALEGAGCTVESFPALPNVPDHSDVPSLTTMPDWNSDPPTSGPHYNDWAAWGFYDEPVPLVMTVHNLEHGGVVIHYGPEFPEAEVEEIREWYDADPNGLVVAPLETNGDRVTLSAWTAPDAATGTSDRGRGFLATCPTFDEAAFDEFVQAHRYQGPERIPPEQLAPGS
jgi:hypothetical protein